MKIKENIENGIKKLSGNTEIDVEEMSKELRVKQSTKDLSIQDKQKQISDSRTFFETAIIKINGLIIDIENIEIRTTLRDDSSLFNHYDTRVYIERVLINDGLLFALQENPVCKIELYCNDYEEPQKILTIPNARLIDYTIGPINGRELVYEHLELELDRFLNIKYHYVSEEAKLKNKECVL